MISRRLQQLGLGHQLLQGCSKVLTEQPHRTTVVVKRKWPVQLGKGNKFGKLRTRNYIYEVVEDKARGVHPPVRVILADNVEGYGAEGDIIDVKATIARKWLLPTGLAVYPSPENIEKYEQMRKERGDTGPRHTAYAMKTIKQLHGMQLYIPMNRNADWTLDKTHVRVAFRKLGVEVPDQCITMPDEEISHDMVGNIFEVGVTVNGIETVPVKAKIVYWELDENGNPPKFPHIWTSQKKAQEKEQTSTS